MGLVCGSGYSVDREEEKSYYNKMLNAIEDGDEKRLKKLLRRGADVNEASQNGYTPLMHASSWGNLECIHRLLYAGADVNIASYNGITALLEAVVNKHPECARYLIRSGADVNARDGQRALNHVLTVGDIRFLKLLIKAGADVSAPYREGKTPLVVAVETKQSKCATLLIEAGADTKCLDFVDHPGADVNSGVNNNEAEVEAESIDAADQQNQPDKNSEKGTDVNNKQGKGASVNKPERGCENLQPPKTEKLFVTLPKQNKTLVNGGIRPGANVNSVNKVKNTYSEVNRTKTINRKRSDHRETDIEEIQYIGEVANPKVDAIGLTNGLKSESKFQDKYSRSAGNRIVGDSVDGGDHLVVNGKCENNNDESMENQHVHVATVHRSADHQTPVKRKDVPPDTQTSPTTPIVEANGLKTGLDNNYSFDKTKLFVFVAVNSKDVERTRHFVEAGGDVNTSGPNGRTPLMMAAASGCEYNPCLEVLTQAGADVNRADRACGYTALMFAAQSGNGIGVNELVTSGADVNVVNQEGKTALDLARAEENGECVKLLTQAGAASGRDVSKRNDVCNDVTMKKEDNDVGNHDVVNTNSTGNSRSADTTTNYRNKYNVDGASMKSTVKTPEVARALRDQTKFVNSTPNVAAIAPSNRYRSSFSQSTPDVTFAGRPLLVNTNLKDMCRRAIIENIDQLGSAESLASARRIGLAPLLRSYLIHCNHDNGFVAGSSCQAETVEAKSAQKEMISSRSSLVPVMVEKSW